MLGPALLGTIRTFVPVVVGSLIAWLLDLGVTVDEGTVDALSLALVGLITAAYYFIVTLLERKVHPYFGVLLGVPKAPAAYIPGGGDENTRVVNPPTA